MMSAGKHSFCHISMIIVWMDTLFFTCWKKAEIQIDHLVPGNYTVGVAMGNDFSQRHLNLCYSQIFEQPELIIWSEINN